MAQASCPRTPRTRSTAVQAACPRTPRTCSTAAQVACSWTPRTWLLFPPADVQLLQPPRCSPVSLLRCCPSRVSTDTTNLASAPPLTPSTCGLLVAPQLLPLRLLLAALHLLPLRLLVAAFQLPPLWLLFATHDVTSLSSPARSPPRSDPPARRPICLLYHSAPP